MLPAFVFLAWLLTRCAPGRVGRALAGQLLIFDIAYPCLAGLDAERQSLYFDLAAVLYLVVAGWLVLRKVAWPPAGMAVAEPALQG